MPAVLQSLHLILNSPDGREQLRLRRVGDGAGGEILEIQGRLLPGVISPPLHIHHLLREETAVTAGRLGVVLDAREYSLVPGETIVFPSGSKHTWWNAGEAPTEFSGRAIPAGDLDRYLQGVFALVNASPTGEPSFFHMAHLLWRHRRTHSLTKPPMFMQRSLLPVVVFVGWILGKYWGGDWPAHPLTCTGAPLILTAFTHALAK